ncbi:MAG: hypothetical protein EOO47_04990 [Flavobacterium sp.]|nr:MAG: hypothetical protein EOO47_04990 [Flavobacterium sp.]
MIKLESELYECEECGSTNDLNSKIGSENINGLSYDIIQCHNCDTRYRLVDRCLYKIEDNLKYSYESSGTDKYDNQDRIPFITYVIFGLFLLGAFALIMDYINKGSDSKVANILAETVNIQPIENKLTDGNIKPIQSAQSTCDFNIARDKALLKVTSLNLEFVSNDELGDQIDLDRCSVTYRFYVKNIIYDNDDNKIVGDKLKHLLLTYRKIGNEFEFIDGKLFMGVDESRYMSIN